MQAVDVCWQGADKCRTSPVSRMRGVSREFCWDIIRDVFFVVRDRRLGFRFATAYACS